MEHYQVENEMSHEGGRSRFQSFLSWGQNISSTVLLIIMLALLALMCVLVLSASAQVPRTISYQGMLTSGDAAANGPHIITVTLYDSLTGGTQLYQESHQLTVANGIFDMEIGSISPLPPTLTFNVPYYLGVSIDGSAELSPRVPLDAAPYAMNAGTAQLAEGLTSNAHGVVTSINELAGALRITGDSITTVTENGNEITIHAKAAVSGIQSIASPDKTIAITNGMGPNATVGVADSAITTAKLANAAVTPQKLAQAGATKGQILKWNGSAWAVANDSVGTTSYVAGQGISISGNTISAAGGLPAGTVLNSTLHWNGASWVENQNMTSDANGNTHIDGATNLGDGLGVDNITMSPGTGQIQVNGWNQGVVMSSATGVLSTSQLTGGAGISITQNANAITITDTGSVGWALTGNTGTSAPTNFLGTIDNQPFEIHINNNDGVGHGSKRVLRFEPNATSANIIAGYQGNAANANVVGATIAGGGLNGYNNTVTDDFGVVGGGSLNRAGNNSGSNQDASHATVAGGGGNTASGLYSSILGGTGNTANGTSATVGGGSSNQATGAYATVTGGIVNVASDSAAVVGGAGNRAGKFAGALSGLGNDASGDYAVISGGISDTASGYYSTIGGGGANKNYSDWGTIAGGGNNTISATGPTIGGGYNNMSNSAYTVISGGINNSAVGSYSTIAGGRDLTLGSNSFGVNVNGSGNTIDLSGQQNLAYFGDMDLWLGNLDNSARAIRFYAPGTSTSYSARPYSAFLAGGQTATINYTLPTTQPSANQVLTATNITGTGPYNVRMGWSTPSGSGNAWNLTGNSGTTPGTNFLGTTDNQAFEIHVYNDDAANKGSRRVFRIEPGAQSPNIIAGYQDNYVESGYWGGTIAGGGIPGAPNVVGYHYGTIGGGFGNYVSDLSTVAGGGYNNALGNEASISGGEYNTAYSYGDVIGGGANDTAGGGMFSTISGGEYNQIGDQLSSIPGGGGLKLGANSFGFNSAWDAASTSWSLGGTADLITGAGPFNRIAYFGNVDVWIGNTGTGTNYGKARQLRFYQNNSANNYSATTYYSAFVAPTSYTNGSIIYTLPTSHPLTNQVLSATAVSGTGPYAVTLGWASASGSAWNLTGNSGTTDGTNFLGTTDNVPFTIRANNVQALRIQPYHNAVPSTIGGGSGNSITSGDTASFIGFGDSNRIGASYSSIIGGNSDTLTGDYSSISAGYGNTVTGEVSAISGGTGNSVSGYYSMIAGGYLDTIPGTYDGFVGAGAYNVVKDENGAIAGGELNTAYLNAFVGGGIANLAGASSHSGSAILGGAHNTVTGDNSVIAGGQSNQIPLGALYTGVLAGVSNYAGGSNSAIVGGGYLRMTGDNSFGFHAGSSSTDSAAITTANTAYFGNVNLWLGNTNNTASQLRFYGAQNGGVTFPGASTHYSSFAAAGQTADINYTLPSAQPSANQVLAATAVSGTGPYAVTLGWANNGSSTTGVIYGPTSLQATLTTRATPLYNIAYASTASDGSAPGAEITSSAGTSGNYNATGLTLTATGTGTGNTTGLSVSASGSSGIVRAIDATGRVNIDGASSYDIGGDRFLWTGANSSNTNTFVGYTGNTTNTENDNTFVGFDAGNANTYGFYDTYIGALAGMNADAVQNTFIGHAAGKTDIDGIQNTFIGETAGYSNTHANGNTFVGETAGYATTTGGGNTFVGAYGVGAANINGANNTAVGVVAARFLYSGSYNSYLGDAAGYSDSAGGQNTMIGQAAGYYHTVGDRNAYFGSGAGSTDTLGEQNTFLGSATEPLAKNLSNATAVGYGATVGSSNSLVLGQSGTNVGVGTSTPVQKFNVENGNILLSRTGTNAADTLEFQGTSTGKTNFVAGAQGTTNITYVLPTSAPVANGNLLLASSGNSSTMAWSSNLVWDNTNSRLGINTASPADPLHSVNATTTDEIAAVYAVATASTTNQSIGVWGDASNTTTTNTGTIGVLATGNGNTTAGQTNVALQINDGEFTMGRTTEAPGTGTDVEAATGGTAYSQQGPSGIVELTLGAAGNLATSAPASGTIQDLGAVTINNRYCESGSIVLVNVVGMTDDGSAPNPQYAAWIVNADNTASGSFVVRIKMIPTQTSASNYSTSDKVRIGYMIVNKSK